MWQNKYESSFRLSGQAAVNAAHCSILQTVSLRAVPISLRAVPISPRAVPISKNIIVAVGMDTCNIHGASWKLVNLFT